MLHRFPIRWITQIDEWEPPHRFTDFQERGPYRLWEHTHTFEPAGRGTLMTDTVRYAIPYGPLGSLAHVAFVRRDLRRIFDYRRDTVAALLGPPASHPGAGPRDRDAARRVGLTPTSRAAAKVPRPCRPAASPSPR